MPEKPHLVLLPGLHGTADLFKPLAEALGGAFKVCAVSYPQGEALGYDRLLELITPYIKKRKPYIVLGESFSGPLAVRAAAGNQEHLLGVVLAASFVTSPMPVWINRLRPFAGGPILDLSPRSFIIDRLLGRGCPRETRKWVHEAMPRLHRETLAARIRDALKVNVREELKRIRAPVLYIAGARDWLVGRSCLDTVWLCRPDVQIKVLEGVHMILQTRPREAAEAIMEFAAGMAQGRGEPR